MADAVSADADPVSADGSTVSDYASEKGAAASTADCRLARKLRLVVPALQKAQRRRWRDYRERRLGTSLVEASIVKA
jgi:hypothetical protein